MPISPIKYFVDVDKAVITYRRMVTTGTAVPDRKPYFDSWDEAEAYLLQEWSRRIFELNEKLEEAQATYDSIMKSIKPIGA